MKRFAVLLALLLSVFTLRPVLSAPLPTSPDALIAEVNALRVANGLPALAPNSILMGVAQAHANYMAATGSVTHYSADGSRPFQRSLAAGYPVAGDLTQGGFHAENIIAGNLTAAEAVQAWLGDAPHTNTMLSPNFTEIGAGVANVNGVYYYVIDASRPASGPIAYTPPPGGTTSAGGMGEYIIPVTLSTPGPDGSVVHVVQSGQTFWAIAIAYETTIKEILRLNGLPENAVIYAGDQLIIRPAGSISPTPVPVNTEILPTVTFTPPPPTPTIPVSTLTPTPAPLLLPGTESNSQSGILILGLIVIVAIAAGILSVRFAGKSSDI